MPPRLNNAAAARQQAEAEAEAARQQAEGQPAANVVLAQRAAAAATELLAKKKLELLRNKIKDDFQKALTSHGKLDSKGENAQKLERSLGLCIGDRVPSEWLESGPVIRLMETWSMREDKQKHRPLPRPGGNGKKPKKTVSPCFAPYTGAWCSSA